jgi:hypothetical protein
MQSLTELALAIHQQEIAIHGAARDEHIDMATADFIHHLRNR